MSQLSIPIDIRQEELDRERTFGGALSLCAKAAGFDLDKELKQTLEVDKAQFSRWKSGTEGVNWKKLQTLMDVCGNHAPVLWMLNELGYDISSLRKKRCQLEIERDTERELRLIAEKEIEALRKYHGGLK